MSGLLKAIRIGRPVPVPDGLPDPDRTDVDRTGRSGVALADVDWPDVDRTG